MRGQKPIVIDDFRGLFDRGPNENCPPNYFIDCSNLEFVFKGFRTRGEFTSTYTFTAVSADIIGQYGFPRLDGTTRRLLLVRQIGGGNLVKLYDIDHSAPPFLVATYATTVDGLSVLPMFDRLYIAALGPKNEHILDAVIQVYDGIAVARNAGGVAPSGASMTATEPGAGNVSAGIHLYAVAFETPSGFITKAGPAAWTNKVSAGSLNINLAGIPTGPAGTVARHLLATKLIPTYGPPQENFELFFLPTGRIADNVTATLTFDYFDTELVNSADYLLDQYEAIPAGPLFSIGNSMGVAGFKNTVPTAPEARKFILDQRSIALISKAVEIEAFSVDEGFVVVNPSLGGPLRNGLDLNGTLFFFKEALTLAIQPDLDSSPANWGSPGVIDSILGTSPNGIALFMGIPFVINGGVFVITKYGLQHFNGSYNLVSGIIDERWTAALTFDFNTSLIVVDPVHRRIYLMMPSASGYPDSLLVADYKDGFTNEVVRWCPWVVPGIGYRGMFTDRDGNLQTTNTSEQIIKYVERVGATTEVIVSFAETAKFRFTNLGHICNFQMILLNVDGAGLLQLDWYSKDAIITDGSTTDITLALNPDKLYKRLANFTSQMASLRLKTDPAVSIPGNYMSVDGLIIYGHVEGEEYPE